MSIPRVARPSAAPAQFPSRTARLKLLTVGDSVTKPDSSSRESAEALVNEDDATRDRGLSEGAIRPSDLAQPHL